MVVAYLGAGGVGLDEAEQREGVLVGPEVHVARRPHVWVGIHQGVALPFEHACLDVALVVEPADEQCRVAVGPSGPGGILPVGCKPGGSHILVGPAGLVGGQAAQAVIHHAHDALLA